MNTPVLNDRRVSAAGDLACRWDWNTRFSRQLASTLPHLPPTVRHQDMLLAFLDFTFSPAASTYSTISRLRI